MPENCSNTTPAFKKCFAKRAVCKMVAKKFQSRAEKPPRKAKQKITRLINNFCAYIRCSIFQTFALVFFIAIKTKKT